MSWYPLVPRLSMPLKTIKRILSRASLTRSPSQLSSASSNNSSAQLKSLVIDSNRLSVTPSASDNDMKKMMTTRADIEDDKDSSKMKKAVMFDLEKAASNDLKKQIKNKCNETRCNLDKSTTLVVIENTNNERMNRSSAGSDDDDDFSDDEKMDQVKEGDCSCSCSCAEDSSDDEGEVSCVDCLECCKSYNYLELPP